jgi:histone H3/H4
MKKYIKDRSGFNTSDQIVDVLSDHVRAICDEAIRCAARDDRKTVLERDIRPPPRR